MTTKMYQRTNDVVVSATLLLVLLSFTSIQAFKTNLPVEIQPDNQVAVKLGHSQTILCKAAVALQVCRFTIPGEDSLVLTPGQPSEDGIDYYGEGLDKGQCGVTISNIKERHDGNVTCYLTPGKGRSESYNSVRMIVAKQPLHPQLHLNKNNGAYKSGEKMEVSCVAVEGRPPANVSLYLDNEPIGFDERPIIYGRPIEETQAILNTSRSVTPSDNGKTLRCVADHIALQQPLETTRQIEVHFPPQPQQTIERFGYAIGRPGKVNVTVQANPKPNFTWKVDTVKINAGMPDVSGRLQTSSPVDLGHGYWSLVLNIDSVQKSDTDKEYSLEAHNNEGYAVYKIILSSSSEPPAGALGRFNQFYDKLSEHMHALGVDLDAGSIIGIVIGVLILILCVFLVIFARATGRWCFAGGSIKRNIGESDFAEPVESVNLLRFVKPKTDDASPRRTDTESTGHYSRSEVDIGKTGGRIRPKISLPQLFKRKKDKVTGTDTDTVRTIVTMDDEKQISSGEKTAGALTTGHEGGIVYAELDLAHQNQKQQGAPRRLTEDKTEYAEILYTKPENQEHPLSEK
ncbi:PREDICTED: fasciclin-3 [Ceratosolen solmsi marchali]|uniref:Fasciclin-3 n=1 Tax=Ceratosolen solmsi marchali TaxID=326594 RepID=A0AAJ6YDM0_9HYME|nr:PREDICTED: fasciclin-3 [Ceratosolen solmsi marchali]